MNLVLLPAGPGAAAGSTWWLLQFACMINGVTKIVMTKADVLDEFKELEVCTSYKINGKESTEIPFRLTG